MACCLNIPTICWGKGQHVTRQERSVCAFLNAFFFLDFFFFFFFQAKEVADVVYKVNSGNPRPQAWLVVVTLSEMNLITSGVICEKGRVYEENCINLASNFCYIIKIVPTHRYRAE